MVACEAGQGGTRAGAIEALKSRWVPVFVLQGPDVPEGNRLLLQKGARPFLAQIAVEELRGWLESHQEDEPLPAQPRLL